jgi:hypothetical protein
VVGAAMELRARFGTWKAAKSVALPSVGGFQERRTIAEGPSLRSGCEWKPLIELVFSSLGAGRRRRGSAHSIATVVEVESGRVGESASEGQLLRGKVGPDLHVGSATRAAPGG